MNTNRHTCRLTQPCTPTGLAEAVHCMTQHSDVALASLVGQLATRDIHVTAKQLQQWSNCYQTDTRLAMPLRVFEGVVRITHSPIALDMIARSIDHHVAPTGTLRPGATRAAQVQDAAFDLITSAGTVIANVRAALADGQFDEADTRKLRAPVRDLLAKATDLLRAIEAAPHIERVSA